MKQIQVIALLIVAYFAEKINLRFFYMLEIVAFLKINQFFGYMCIAADNMIISAILRVGQKISLPISVKALLNQNGFASVQEYPYLRQENECSL